MIHFRDKGTYVLGVYVADRLENPDSVIRMTLGLENQRVLTPEEMYSVKAGTPYVLNATKKTVYSKPKFLGSDIHIYLEKSSGRVLVRIRHSTEELEVHQAIEGLVHTLDEKGFRPVHSSIEDIPDFALF